MRVKTKGQIKISALNEQNLSIITTDRATLSRIMAIQQLRSIDVNTYSIRTMNNYYTSIFYRQMLLMGVRLDTAFKTSELPTHHQASGQ